MESNLMQVVFFSLVGGVFSLVGGALLLTKKKLADVFAKYALPFAAGALLAAAFVDLIPDALHEIAHLSGHKAIDSFALSVSMAVMCGILGFFLLERAIHWFHHHRSDGDEKHEKDARVPLIILGDTVHNFIDGVAIAAAFLVDSTTGIMVTAAVAAHEIPQEVSDFGLLLAKGMSRGKVLLVNALSALATTVAAVIFFLIGSGVEIPLGIVLGLTAGFFIYIAVSDIIPAIHARERKHFVGAQTVLLIVGIVVVSSCVIAAHRYIHIEEEHGGHNEHCLVEDADGCEEEQEHKHDDTEHDEGEHDEHGHDEHDHAHGDEHDQ
jgi:zinc and cadmium transporter